MIDGIVLIAVFVAGVCLGYKYGKKTRRKK